MYTRDTQKLIWWLISCYANFQTGNDVQSTPSQYSLWQAEKELKKMYIEATNYRPPKTPLEDFVIKWSNKLSLEQFNELKTDYIRSIQGYLFSTGDFSLALSMLTQDGANKFLNFMLEFLIGNGIPVRKEIIELMEEKERRQVIFICLLHKTCCICGRPITFPHHHDSVAIAGGYAKDKGDLPIAPLCPYHHSEYHSCGLSKDEWQQKYPTYGYITCTDKEKEILQKIYNGLFTAYKSGDVHEN